MEQARCPGGIPPAALGLGFTVVCQVLRLRGVRDQDVRASGFSGFGVSGLRLRFCPWQTELSLHVECARASKRSRLVDT